MNSLCCMCGANRKTQIAGDIVDKQSGNETAIEQQQVGKVDIDQSVVFPVHYNTPIT